MARQQQNGSQYVDPSEYDLGQDVDDGAPYQGPQPASFAPAQQQQQRIPTQRAVPPQDPRTGRFVKTDQELRQHPLQQGSFQTRQQYQQQSQQFGQDQEPVEPYEHPRGLLRRALEVGFSDEEIDNTPTEQLESLVWSRKGQAANESRRQSNFQAMQQPVQQQQTLQQQVAQTQQQQAPQLDQDEDVNFGEFEQVMDQGFVKTLKDNLKKTLLRLKAQEKRLMEIDAREQQRQQQAEQAQKHQQFASRMDRMFSKHAQFLGDERWQDLNPGDPNAVKRQAVLQIAQADQSARTDQEKVDAAVATLFGLQQRRRQAPQQQGYEQQPQGRSPRQQQWADAGLQRPTQRRPAPEVNGVRKAIANVTGYLDQMGSDAGSNGMADYDDFLGGENQ